MVDIRYADLVLAALLNVLHLQESVVGPLLRLSETHIDAALQIIDSISCAFPRLFLGEAGLLHFLENLLLLLECLLIALSE